MAGLMSTNTPMIICESPLRGPIDVESLRRGAFTNEVDADGLRTGWVGLGELLDYDNFFLASCDNRFAGFSWRMDCRRPSPAVVRLQVAEKLRAEAQQGSKITAKRKKEIREAIVDKLTAQAEFVPSLVDCIWDGDKGRFFILSSSEKLAERIMDDFVATFAAQIQRVEPDVDLSDKFAKIQQNNGISSGAWSVQPTGTAQLKGMSADQPKSITVQNSLETVVEALKQEMLLLRLGMIATDSQNPERQIEFVADAQMTIMSLRLPKAEKGAEEEATFLINADICSRTAEIMEELAEVRREAN